MVCAIPFSNTVLVLAVNVPLFVKFPARDNVLELPLKVPAFDQAPATDKLPVFPLMIPPALLVTPVETVNVPVSVLPLNVPLFTRFPPIV